MAQDQEADDDRRGDHQVAHFDAEDPAGPDAFRLGPEVL
jgi:hypothetical protein